MAPNTDGAGKATEADAARVLLLLEKAQRFYKQWRMGLWSGVAEMRGVRPDVDERVFRLVQDLIDADLAGRNSEGK